MNYLTPAELARVLGVKPRRIYHWIDAGCPTVMVDGQLRLVLDEVKAWRRVTGRTGRAGRPKRPEPSTSQPEAAPPQTTAPPTAPTAQAPVPNADGAGRGTAVPSFERAPLSTKDVKDRADAARKIAAAKKEELDLEQERGLEELAERIRRVTSADELTGLDLEVAALVAAGRMKHQRGQALRQLLAQAHKAMSGRAEEAEAEEGVFLLSKEGIELAQEYDRLGNGWRRRWLREAMALHRVEDQRELPGWDGDMRPVLQALEIDALGEPVGGSWPARFTPPAVAPALVSRDLPPCLRREHEEGGAA